MSIKKRRKFSFKIWLECNGEPVLGRGGAEILEKIEAEKSISEAAKKLEMSYRYVWNYLQKINKILGEPVIETFKGGKHGGGGAKLTVLGKDLLNEYRQLEKRVGTFLQEINREKEKTLR